MPELHYKDGGAWRKAKELYYKDGGIWRRIREAWYRDGGVWRKVYSGLHSLALNLSTVTGSASTDTAGAFVQATTAAAVVSVTGGIGPFTYSWSYVSGSSATVVSSTSASTTFRRNGAAPSVIDTTNSYSGVYRCTVTDTGAGGATATIDVTVTTYHTYAI